MDALRAHIGRDGFRLRGVAMSRIDAFSDAVFAFALTLLVVSLEVPKGFAELQETMAGFVPFAICFGLLLMIWYEHYKFFRRFGLHDLRTIVLNAVLLFLLLFYVYPLKFLCNLIVAQLMGNAEAGRFTDPRQPVALMVLYGGGFAAIYLMIAALYWNGWKRRAELDLNLLERTLAKNYMVDAAGMAAIGLLSCALALALPVRLLGLSGWAYVLIGVFKSVHGRRERRQAAQSRAQMPEQDFAARGVSDGV
jgi:uncharacterized membrane protein